MRLLSNEKPQCENLCQTRIYIIRSLANLVNLETYPQMTFDECMQFIMNDTRCSVSPHQVQTELLILFEDRGFDIRFAARGP